MTRIGVAMPSYKLTVAYIGTEYCGFQVQPNGPTIQGELMKAGISLFGEDVTVTGASRTDSGVHAKGQVVVLKGSKDIPARKVPMAMNVRLPDDIVIVDAQPVADLWHPRYCNHHKTYEYKIFNGAIQFPQDKKDSYHFKRQLDIGAMKEAAAKYVGTHDFESYSSSGKSTEDTIRTIYWVDITEVRPDMLSVRVCGNGFLYNMVRIMVGTLLDVGVGKIDQGTIECSLSERNRALAGHTAPAHGLTLLEIDYMDEKEKDRV